MMPATGAQANVRTTMRARGRGSSARIKCCLVDKMPTYTKKWITANLALYLEHSTPGQTCEICFESFTTDSPARGPIQGEAPTRCRHFCCAECWKEILRLPNSNMRCPMCREDCSTWLINEFAEFPSDYDIPLAEIREFVSTAMVQLRDQPRFVALARIILSGLAPF